MYGCWIPFQLRSLSPQSYCGSQSPHPVLGHPVITSLHLTINTSIMATLLGAPLIIIIYLAHIADVTGLSMVPLFAISDFVKYLHPSLSLCWSLGCRSVDCGGQCIIQCGCTQFRLQKDKQCVYIHSYYENDSYRFCLPPYLHPKFQ